ncbi:5865_t:CDS:2, partial [Gigaspora margarita]
KHISLHYGDYTSMDIKSLYSQVKFKSLRYCSKPVPVINYYNNDPVPEVINNNESESVAKLKNNFIKIKSPDYQLVSETIIKVQHGNLDDVNEQITIESSKPSKK